MIQKILLFLLLPFALSFGAPLQENLRRIAFPTAGVINPKQGTVEITITPSADIKDLGQGWPFAIQILGKVNDPQTRTILGIYSPARSRDGKQYGLYALLRTRKGPIYLIDRNSPVKAGQSVNLAVTWGPKGMIFYESGRRIGGRPFPAELHDLAPELQVINSEPFRTSRIKVSACQLPPSALQKNAAEPFRADPECTLLANDLARPQFFAAPEIRRLTPISLIPFDSTASRIVPEGKTFPLSFVGNNLTDREVALPVEFRLTGFNEKNSRTIRRTVTLPAGSVQQEKKVTLPVLSAGFYSANIRAGKEDWNFSLSVLPDTGKAPAGRLEEYLGTAAPDDAAILRKLGIRWTRSWNASHLLWHQLEPGKGKFDFRSADRAINNFRKNGVNVLAVLGYPPFWAAEKPDFEGPEGSLFERNPGTWKPKSIEDWKRYVERTAEHFKGRVTHYEIWNEVDWHPPKRAASFSGTTKEYYELLTAASRILHRSAPENRVLISGFGSGEHCDQKMPEDLLKLGAADYIDAWNLHAYSVTTQAKRHKQLVHAVKPGMPLWQSEQMWHVIQDPHRRAYLTAIINFWFLELGFEKYFSFGWGSFLSDYHTSSPELPLHVLGVCQKYLRQCDRFSGRIPGLPEPDFDAACTLLRTDGTHLSVLGSSAGNYEVRVKNRTLSVRDMLGREVRTKNGILPLNGQILYVISPEPLKVRSFRQTGIGQLLANPGFEDLTGDDLDGIDKCSFATWQLRTQRDPEGRISIAEKSGRSGKYAARISASGKDVYLFSYLRLPAPGNYRMTAHFRTLSGSPRPYLSLFDTTPKSWLKRKVFPTPPKDRFVKLTFDIKVDKLPGTVAAIFGILGKGEVLLDDVELFRYDPPRLEDDRAIPIPIPDRKQPNSLISKTGMIHLGWADVIGTGKKQIAGIPFHLNSNWLAAADSEWKNAGKSETLRFPPASADAVWLLGATMYNPQTPGTLLADFELVYEDGTRRILPIRAQKETADWFLAGHSKDSSFPPGIRFESPELLAYGLFPVRMANPLPEKRLTGIVLKNRNRGIVAFKAVTLEKRNSK